MKKIFLIILLFTSSIIFAQDSIEYSYKIKLQGVTDKISASNIMDIMEGVFQTKTPFNDTTCCFEFQTKMCVNGTGFSYVMKDETYIVLLFDKQEIILSKKVKLI
jgi:hypothetical protein